MHHLRLCTCLVAFLAVVGCRQTKPEPERVEPAGPGTLRVAAVPEAEVVIDGEVAGTTPLTRALDAGPHEIILRSEAFEDHHETVMLIAGGIADVDRVLVAKDPGDPLAIAKLAAGFGIGEVSGFEPVVRHRGAIDTDFVVPLYPRGDVRLKDLFEFRIDVGEEFEAEGKLVFKRGAKVLFETEFKPEGPATIAPVPDDVIAGLKSGAQVTWGFHPAKGKAVTAKFRVVKEEPRLAKRLAKMEERLADQPEVTLAQMRAQLYLNKKLYTAAYLEARRALGLAEGDEVPPAQALAVMQSAAQRMNLRQTPLWHEIEADIDRVPERVKRRHSKVR